ncbi:MAG: MarR family winged helix-turn-helix transcriptional regulator [Sulfurifustaceae bacterium]
MNEKLSEITLAAWARLMRAQQTLLERVEADLKKAELPPLGWYDVLIELNRADDGRLRQFEVGDKVLLSKYNVSRLLDRLEQEGLVRREACKEDRRGAHVAITREGKALLKKMWPVYERAITEYFARHLSEGETAQLAELMQRLIVKPT